MYTRSLLLGLLTVVLTVGLVSCDSSNTGSIGESTSVALSESNAVVGEGEGTQTVDVTITDPGFKEVGVSAVFNESQSSAARGEDIAVPTSTLRFPESTTSGASRSLEIEIIDDDSDEAEETATFDLRVPDSVEAEAGDPSQFALTIQDNDEALPAFELAANASDLEPASGNGSTECMVQLSSGELVFFNAADGGIFIWDGSSLSEHRSASDLNSDVPDESGDFDSCDGAATNGDNAYFVFRNSDSNVNFVYRTSGADASDNSFEEFNGANAVAAGASTVYTGTVAAFGAESNGIFEIDSGLSGDFTEVVTSEEVNPATISLEDGGTLFGYSSSFGSGSLEAALFTLDVTASSPSLNPYLDPYQDGSPLNEAGNEIQDVAPVTVDGEQLLVVYNASFDGPNAEEWAVIQRSDQSFGTFFAEGDLTENLPVEGYSSGGAPLVVTGEGDILAASIPDFGGGNYIARIQTR